MSFRSRGTLFSCMLLLLGACTSGDSTPVGTLTTQKIAARVAQQHLNRHLSAAVRTFDPLMNQDVPGTTVAQDLFEGLLRTDPAGKIIAGVAQQWECSVDGLTWTFHLRHNALWSNGDKVSANDFVYAWRRMVNPATTAPMAQELAPIVGASQIMSGKAAPQTLAVKALDDYTLQVQLNVPTPYLEYMLTTSFMMPVHEATVAREGRGWTRPGVMVNNGAFLLKSVSINGPIEMEKNPRYWDADAVRLTGVTYYALPDSSAATSRFLAGDLDVTDRFQMEDFDWLRNSLGAQVRISPYTGTVMLGMHAGKPPFDSKPLRRAMVLAIDREMITQHLMKGQYEAAYGIVPPLPGYPPFRPAWADLRDSDRIALARKYYAEAGYSPQHPLDVEFNYNSGNPEMNLVFDAMAAMWRQHLGANVRLAGEDWKVHLQNREIHKPRMFWWAWIADYPDPQTFMALPLTNGEQNYGRYHNAQYDAHVKAAMATASRDERNAQFNAAERVLDADAVAIPIYYYRTRHLVRDFVRGWEDNPMDNHLSRDLYLEMPGTQ
ncbi:MAG: peptide ABC transporter substrate-binding protein [Pseudomonadota bacterium]